MTGSSGFASSEAQTNVNQELPNCTSAHGTLSTLTTRLLWLAIVSNFHVHYDVSTARSTGGRRCSEDSLKNGFQRLRSARGGSQFETTSRAIWRRWNLCKRFGKSMQSSARLKTACSPYLARIGCDAPYLFTAN